MIIKGKGTLSLSLSLSSEITLESVESVEKVVGWCRTFCQILKFLCHFTCVGGYTFERITLKSY